MSDSSSPTDYATKADDSHEENPFESHATKDFLVESEDMVEIAMSLRQISDVLESRTINPTMAGATTSESGFWLDDDYLYVEIEHRESDDLMMDICVHRGRAFIRVERDGLGVGLAELAV